MSNPIRLMHNPTDLKGWPAAVRFFGYTGVLVLIIISITSSAIIISSITKYLNIDLTTLTTEEITESINFDEPITDEINATIETIDINAEEALKDTIPIFIFIPVSIVTAILVLPLWLYLLIHSIMFAGYTITAIVLSIINWIYTVIAKKRHEGITFFIRQYITWIVRFQAWIFGVTDKMVNLDFDCDRNNDHPIQVQYDATEINPTIAWLRIIIAPFAVMLIPHFIVLPFKIFFAFVGSWLRWIGSIFSKKVREKKKENTLAVRYLRWTTRFVAYALGIEDAYPPIAAKE